MIRRAYVLKVDGTIEHLDHRPTLEEAQKVVGGWVEMMPMHLCRTPRLTAFGDEEGRLKGYALNRKATDLLSYPVVGAILILEGWKTLAENHQYFKRPHL